MSAEPSPHVRIETLLAPLQACLNRVQAHVPQHQRERVQQLRAHSPGSGRASVLQLTILMPPLTSEALLRHVAVFSVDVDGCLFMECGNERLFRDLTKDKKPRTPREMLAVMSTFIPKHEDTADGS